MRLRKAPSGLLHGTTHFVQVALGRDGHPGKDWRTRQLHLRHVGEDFWVRHGTPRHEREGIGPRESTGLLEKFRRQLIG